MINQTAEAELTTDFREHVHCHWHLMFVPIQHNCKFCQIFGWDSDKVYVLRYVDF